jgi:hypothetical protein
MKLILIHNLNKRIIVEDLVHEESLGLPILQISLGRFIHSSRDRIGIAVLHPRRLQIYEIIPQSI